MAIQVCYHMLSPLATRTSLYHAMTIIWDILISIASEHSYLCSPALRVISPTKVKQKAFLTSTTIGLFINIISVRFMCRCNYVAS